MWKHTFSSLPALTPEQVRAVAPHAIFVDNEGNGMRLRCTETSVACPRSYDEHLRLIADHVRRSGRQSILIRVHGGLNLLKNSLTTTDDMLRRMSNDQEARFYPIFVNWESGLVSAYLEHLLVITQGQRYPNLGRALIAPLYLAADLGRAAARFWFVWAQPLINFWKGDKTSQRDARKRVIDGLVESEGGYRRSSAESASFHTRAMLLSPVRALLSVLVDAGGVAAWDNMHRRTKTMFRNPNEFRDVSPRADGRYSPPSGAVSQLLETVGALAAGDPSLRFTLVGHSMGAIVVDEMVRAAPHLPIEAIVFMAAASSIREFEVAVLPYLQSSADSSFYNLTLHPLADLREESFLKLAPSGSLLEWLDGFLANPETDLDRMLGKYANVRAAEHLFPPGVRERVRIKAFGYHDGTGCGPHGEPTHHGGFNDPSVPFWRHEFWEPGLPCPGAPNQSVAPS